MLVGFDFGVGQEGDHSVLKGAETAFNFAFGLGRWRDEVGDTKPTQGALELAFRIAVVTARTWTKKAQAVRANRFWQAVSFKRTAEVLEVISSGLGGNKRACDVALGVVIDGG